MTQLLFFANASDLIRLEPGQSPGESFVCTPGMGIHADARAQLYSIVTGEFLQDTMAMEELVDDLATEATWVSRLPDELVARLGALDEQTATDAVKHWMFCEEIEHLQISEDDLLEYLFALINLCENALQEDACVYTYTVV